MIQQNIKYFDFDQSIASNDDFTKIHFWNKNEFKLTLELSIKQMNAYS